MPVSELQRNHNQQNSGPPGESRYARKLRLEAEGLWKFPQPKQELVAPVVQVVAAPAKVITPTPPAAQPVSQPKGDSLVSQWKWRDDTFKSFDTVQRGGAWVTVEGEDYFLPSFKIKVACLTPADLYEGREVQVRLHYKEGVLIVKSIQLPEGPRV